MVERDVLGSHFSAHGIDRGKADLDGALRDVEDVGALEFEDQTVRAIVERQQKARAIGPGR